jgi:hypothetical protein
MSGEMPPSFDHIFVFLPTFFRDIFTQRIERQSISDWKECVSVGRCVVEAFSQIMAINGYALNLKMSIRCAFVGHAFSSFCHCLCFRAKRHQSDCGQSEWPVFAPNLSFSFIIIIIITFIFIG